MYKKILVPVEPSHVERHETALKMAKQLADDGGAEIIALTVIEPVPGYFAMAESMPDMQLKAGEETLKQLRSFVGDGSSIKSRVLHGHAATEIIGYAEREGVDCIVIASHKPEFVDFFLGSTAARVVRHATCSVHVIR
ncbi:MAG: universal stress protein [Silicimonas sp.]|jgi:nucleotide-binding universal stress UspA family protein|nr:universal stress protein [Silicimonas sp.]